jgi:hypothetical protein
MIDEEPSLGVADAEPAAIWMALVPYGAHREALFKSLPSALDVSRWISLLAR